jgi:hypothetical protein
MKNKFFICVLSPVEKTSSDLAQSPQSKSGTGCAELSVFFTKQIVGLFIKVSVVLDVKAFTFTKKPAF